MGYKSFLNDFFYVDGRTISQFGIEPEFLVPLFMLADLDLGSYIQTSSPSRWVFYCKEEPSDLRGTGAWRYIKWGSRQETEARRQTKERVRWPEAPALQHQKRWYWPAAPLHPARLAVRKAYDMRYAPFVFNAPVILDQRLYLLSEAGGVDQEILTAYLASSLFPLALETNADLGLGAGALTLGANSLRRLPSVDLVRVSESSQADPIRSALRALMTKRPVDSDSYYLSPEIRALDSALLESLGIPTDRCEHLESQLAHLAEIRTGQGMRRRIVKAQASVADIDAVADQVAELLSKWKEARHFPEDSMIPGQPVLRVSLPRGPLSIRTDPVMGLCALHISGANGEVFMDTMIASSVAELILRSAQMGRREFTSPAIEEQAGLALQALNRLLDEFEVEFDKALAGTSLGRRYASAVSRIALEKVEMPLQDLRRAFGAREWRVGVSEK